MSGTDPASKDVIGSTCSGTDDDNAGICTAGEARGRPPQTTSPVTTSTKAPRKTEVVFCMNSLPIADPPDRGKDEVGMTYACLAYRTQVVPQCPHGDLLPVA